MSCPPPEPQPVGEVTRSDRGAALPMVAGMLVMLLGLSAFAVDLGWLYLNSSRVQRAADAAALAGVIHLPSDEGAAEAQAITASDANGFTVAGDTALVSNPLADNKLEVTISTEIPSFFVRILGIDSFSLVRRATAEYVKPVPIGSPFSSFGDGSNNLWASINGRWTAHVHGDPYQSQCDWATDLGVCVDSSTTRHTSDFSGQTLQPGDIDPDTNPENPEYRGDGYYYGVEIQDDRTSLTLELLDPRFRRRTSNPLCGTTMGDCDLLTLSPLPPNASTLIGPDTTYRLRYPDGSPLDPTDNPPVGGSCDQTYSPSAGNSQGWSTLCTINDPAPGIWVLQVSTTNGSGANQYGVRATTTGSGTNTPRVYGINQVSIYTNQASSSSTLYIAEVDPIHSGKTLELRFFDAGEDDGSASFTMKTPDGSIAQCEWESESGLTGGPGDCVIPTTQPAGSGWEPRFNAQWLTALVEIPDTYTCDITTQLGCWWSMTIENSKPHDRTTWEARIIGNPVRLVPNQ